MNTRTKSKTNDILAYLDERTANAGDQFYEYKTELLRILLSESLKKMRTNANCSQTDMAIKLGVTQSWVSKLESPNNDHTVESIARYLLSLDLDFKLSASFSDHDYILFDTKTGPAAVVSGDGTLGLPDFMSISEDPMPVTPSQVLAAHFWSADLSPAHKSDEASSLGVQPVPGKIDSSEWWRKPDAA